MKIKVDKAKMYVKGKFSYKGSVLAGTIKAKCDGIESWLEVTSSEDPEKIEKLLRNAEAGCFVLQSLENPVKVERTITLNGSPLEVET